MHYWQRNNVLHAAGPQGLAGLISTPIMYWRAFLFYYPHNMYVCMYVYMYVRMDAWMDACMDGWMGGCTYVRMYAGWMDGWMPIYFYLRIDYCGFGPFSSTLTDILILISLPKIEICIIHL